MADPEHLAKATADIEVWAPWRGDHPETKLDLSGADLSGAYLGSRDFTAANLSRTNLRGADLKAVNLRRADLTHADLSKAVLFEADLRVANLREANLNVADLTHANLTGANLSGANLRLAELNITKLDCANLTGTNLTSAYLKRTSVVDTDFGNSDFGLTILADIDLARAKGLSTVRHRAPSSVGIDTVYLSQGEIPGMFLRGCGVPEQFITYARSLVGQAIQFYSCFISYSSQDQEFAERLNSDLRAKGLRCWFAPEDLKIGDRFQDRIEE